MRGYYGVALFEPKDSNNWGTVLRNAYNFEADFVCTIGNRYYKHRADVVDAQKHIPIFHYDSWKDFISHIPKGCRLVGVEVYGKRLLRDFVHPERAIYILGGEDRTIPQELLKGKETIHLETRRCLNVAVTSGIVMYDRSVSGKYQ